jgi:ABC-type branched-subunit amino acid transport system substrate-binding protein
LNDAITYHAAKVMIEGLKRAGKNLTRENFVDALETLKNFDSGTMTSTYSASEHCGLTYVNFQQWQADGTAKIIATGIESKD